MGKLSLCSEVKQGNEQPFHLSETPHQSDMAGVVKIVKANYVPANIIVGDLCTVP